MKNTKIKTIKNGNKIAKIDFGDFSIDELIESLKKSKIKLKKVIEYKKIKSVRVSDDNKRIFFEFSNNNKLYFNLVDYKFYHSGGSAIKQSDLFIDDYQHISDLVDLCDLKWVKTFLYLISNEYDRLEQWIIYSRKNKKTILFFEHLSKQEYIQNFVSNENFDINFFDDSNFFDLGVWDEFRDLKKFNEKYEWCIKNAYKISRDCDRILFSPAMMLCFEYAYKNKMSDVFKYVFDNYDICLPGNIVDNIKKLASLGYEAQRLSDYLFRDLRGQGISISFNNQYDDYITTSIHEGCDYDENSEEEFSPISTLVDYARMNVEMKREYEKYPRYLKSFHDITVRNYNLFKRKSANAKFQKVMKTFAKYEYKNEVYSIVSPKIADDLVSEGVRLNHCVASYIDDVSNKKTCIMFLRKNLSPETPLITLEIQKNRVVQAKGKNNSNPGPDENKFIDEYKKYLKNMNSVKA